MRPAQEFLENPSTTLEQANLYHDWIKQNRPLLHPFIYSKMEQYADEENESRSLLLESDDIDYDMAQSPEEDLQVKIKFECKD